MFLAGADRCYTAYLVFFELEYAVLTEVTAGRHISRDKRMCSLLFGRGSSGFHFAGEFLQVGDSRGIQLIQRGLVIALGNVIVAGLCDQNFFDALAVI